jgi:hypothetical protein
MYAATATDLTARRLRNWRLLAGVAALLPCRMICCTLLASRPPSCRSQNLRAVATHVMLLANVLQS